MQGRTRQAVQAPVAIRLRLAVSSLIPSRALLVAFNWPSRGNGNGGGINCGYDCDLCCRFGFSELWERLGCKQRSITLCGVKRSPWMSVFMEMVMSIQTLKLALNSRGALQVPELPWWRWKRTGLKGNWFGEGGGW